METRLELELGYLGYDKSLLPLIVCDFGCFLRLTLNPKTSDTLLGFLYMVSDLTFTTICLFFREIKWLTQWYIAT